MREIDTQRENYFFKFNAVNEVIISLLAEWVCEGRGHSAPKTIIFEGNELVGKLLCNRAAQKVYDMFHCGDRR